MIVFSVKVKKLIYAPKSEPPKEAELCLMELPDFLKMEKQFSTSWDVQLSPNILLLLKFQPLKLTLTLIYKKSACLDVEFPLDGELLGTTAMFNLDLVL